MILIRAALERDNFTQILCATHSPVLAAIPGAQLLGFTAEGMRKTVWENLELVTKLRHFLTDPQQYLRYLG